MEKASSTARVFLSWRDVSVKVRGSMGQTRYLLQDVTGYAEPGGLLAIMGSSGSGKTTLLNALAGRLGTAVLEKGEVLANGRRQRLPYGNLAYVMQDHSLIPTLSVYETLVYSAHLQLPATMSVFEKQARVQQSIREMGLQACANTRVGCWYANGLSGGEKRRLSIAIEIIKQPLLLFLDEPTSGLDSATVVHVVKRLRALAKGGRTIILSIHQPNSEVFGLFDQLGLLCKGRTIYFGDGNKAQQFFDDAGFPCPTFRNPADHFLWVMNSDFEEIRYSDIEPEDIERNTNPLPNIQVLIKFYRESSIQTFVNARIQQALEKEGDIKTSATGGVNICTQAFYLTSRSFTHMRRDLTYYWFRLCVYVLLAIVLGTIYYKVGLSYNAIQARASLLMFVTSFLSLMGVMSFPSFVEDMKIFTRERLNGHYGVAAFAIANTTSSFPFIILISLIPGAIVYTLSGLHPGLGHFFYFFISLLACLSAVEGLLMSIASLVPNYLLGMMAGSGIMGIYSLTGGFFRIVDELPKPIWRYPFSYISFNTWINKAFYNNDFNGLHFENSIADGPPLAGEDIIHTIFQMDMVYSKWWATFVLVWMAITYRVIFFFAMKLRENLPMLMHKLLTRKVVVMAERAFSGRFVAPREVDIEDDLDFVSSTSA